MTEELEKEAEKYALEKCKECYMCNSEENGERGYCPKFESRKEGYIAGATEGFKRGLKTKINTTTISDAPQDHTWHDLRKNPEDTPPLGVIVMTYDFINNTYRFTAATEKEWYKGRQIAWRKLPEPPEE